MIAEILDRHPVRHEISRNGHLEADIFPGNQRSILGILAFFQPCMSINTKPL